MAKQPAVKTRPASKKATQKAPAKVNKKAPANATKKVSRQAGLKASEGKTKPAARKKKPAASSLSVGKSAAASLGRPKVTGDEKLYLLFKEDFHARQIFEFLRVETVRELEAHSPQEIIRRLSQPLRETVDRIRKLLAEKNRHLLDDQEFALQHHAKVSIRMK